MTAAERPATGATDADIEAAMDRRRRRTLGYSDRSIDRESCRTWASHLVPPGHVIALAEHVADAADRAAIGRVATYFAALNMADQKLDDDSVEAGEQLAKWLGNWIAANDAVTPDDLARLERLRGEGSGNERPNETG